MLVGEAPYWNQDAQALMNIVKNGVYAMSSPIWSTLAPEAVDLVKRLMNPQPAERLSAAAALQHKWIANSVDVTATRHRLDVQESLKNFLHMRLKAAMIAAAAVRRMRLYSAWRSCGVLCTSHSHPNSRMGRAFKGHASAAAAAAATGYDAAPGAGHRENAHRCRVGLVLWRCAAQTARTRGTERTGSQCSDFQHPGGSGQGGGGRRDGG